MPKKSAGTKITRKSAAEISPASQADLDRLRAAMEGDIDTSEITERTTFHRLNRDENGNLSPKWSMQNSVQNEITACEVPEQKPKRKKTKRK